jgi:dipeptidase D
MSNDIRNLEPKTVWNNFYSLTQIPRPSKKEAKVIAFMKKFGEELGLETIVDSVGNVIIRKPATPGMENRTGVILQSHLDMVPQKNSDKKHDFETDPIETIIDGEWVRANKTTLGADNGIGAAAIMSVLAAKDLTHGPVEALFTIDEETGMTGAFGLKAGLLNGKILLNLDSEDEGELYIGCAGGVNGNASFCYEEVAVPGNVSSYKIEIKGLKGGHSGLDIPLGRGNANKLIIRLLYQAAKEFGLRVSTMQGGNMRNAIPREAFANVTILEKKAEAFEAYIAECNQILRKELAETEPDLEISVKAIEKPGSLMDLKSQNMLLNSVYACPNGVIRMSQSMENLVETSTNLAIVKVANNKVEIYNLLRSSVESAKQDLMNTLESVFAMVGIAVEFNGSYPGWKPNVNSPILVTMKDTYNQKFGRIPEIKAIHAGLECGLFSNVYPDWDMISFGPTIRHPHSPDEKVNIASVGKFWDYLVETLKNIPVK